MKKILLGVIFCCLWSVNLFAQVDRFTGIPEVYTGEKHLYRIWFNTPLKEDAKYVIRTGKFGTFSDSSDTARVVNVAKGKMYYEFWVTWGNTATTNAKITAYKNGGAPTSAKTYTVKIMEKSVNPPVDPPVSPSKKITGNKTIDSGSDNMYSFHVYSGHQVEWFYDTELLEEIDNPIHDHRSITLRPKYGATTSVTRNIIAQEYVRGELAKSDTISIKINLNIPNSPKFNLLSSVSNNSIICNNSTVSYTLTNLVSNNIKINWQGQNLSLVSGQDTSNAIFKGSGNGVGKVKATVSYNGQTFEMENSDVWVGAPSSSITIIGFESASKKLNPSTTYTFMGQEHSSINTYNWTVKGSATLESVHTGGRAADVHTNYVPYGTSTSFSLGLSLSNQCGTTGTIWRTGILDRTSSGGGSIEDPDNSIERLESGVMDKLRPATSQSSTPVSIKVYNLNTGSLVYQKKNVVNFNIQSTELNDGIYIVETTDSEGNKTSEKVFKKR
ncbi:hypothetical protein M2451_004047 [Dysgonomonas sp. PFB1-18]|uniref:T9SS type A sorting domain-containing protein n=1 Tax=unclassified Dysgonomonas TaxID=2630389 RepID=UPI0024771205|nr:MULTISPECIES: T9SS type A sorting domain-containing protein [unclassified Dysgonomonas]MDH6311150.1 hypothetical protein [Dysgonomonas sp. PF1-14]MDH6340004.1 hypothetical protein [Dysgonomonas sp. PF1-16]MDH6382700.1 hypothetical protein [Dysgonomonas sp. PFB1-18]MDH6398869.1 hypothetical protein [Dysgonomonas sp. PF1-23]